MRANDNPRPDGGASEFMLAFTSRMEDCRNLIEALTMMAGAIEECEKGNAIFEIATIAKGRLFELERDAQRILYPAYNLLNEIRCVHAREQEGHAA